MKTKLLAGILVCIGILACTKIYMDAYKSVNQKWQDAPETIYQKNEKVYMEDNILTDCTMKGYAVEVTDTEISEYHDYLKKYGGEDDYTYEPDKVYEVTIRLWNEDAAEGTGVNLIDLYIQGTGVYSNINMSLLELANPDLQGNAAIALRQNSSIEIHLPFNLNKSFFRKKIWENIENYDMRLVVTLYPEKRCIALL